MCVCLHSQAKCCEADSAQLGPASRRVASALLRLPTNRCKHEGSRGSFYLFIYLFWRWYFVLNHVCVRSATHLSDVVGAQSQQLQEDSQSVRTVTGCSFIFPGWTVAVELRGWSNAMSVTVTIGVERTCELKTTFCSLARQPQWCKVENLICVRVVKKIQTFKWHLLTHLLLYLISNSSSLLAYLLRRYPLVINFTTALISFTVVNIIHKNSIEKMHFINIFL